MTALESIVEELKTLPSSKLEEAAGFIHSLKTLSIKERKATLQRLRGTMSNEDAAEMTRIIEEGCEQIDKGAW